MALYKILNKNTGSLGRRHQPKLCIQNQPSAQKQKYSFKAIGTEKVNSSFKSQSTSNDIKGFYQHPGCTPGDNKGFILKKNIHCL